jgi:hypothetical protein
LQQAVDEHGKDALSRMVPADLGLQARDEGELARREPAEAGERGEQEERDPERAQKR